MKKKIFLLFFSMNLINSYFLFHHKPLPKTRAEFSLSTLPFSVFISMFHLEELAVGWLWLQFDFDSLNQVKNYHRLLVNLDLITTIKPDEFHAWGLKTWMRYKHYEQEQPQISQKAVEDLKKIQALYPKNSQGWYEVAYILTFLTHQYQEALEFSQKNLSLSPDDKSAILLHRYIQKKILLTQK